MKFTSIADEVAFNVFWSVALLPTAHEACRAPGQFIQTDYQNSSHLPTGCTTSRGISLEKINGIHLDRRRGCSSPVAFNVFWSVSLFPIAHEAPGDPGTIHFNRIIEFISVAHGVPQDPWHFEYFGPCHCSHNCPRGTQGPWAIHLNRIIEFISVADGIT